MKIKKYVAPTLQEAVNLMKTELGSEAIILSTRIVKDAAQKGLQKIFEVVACIDEKALAKGNEEAKRSAAADEPEDINFELEKLREKIYNTFSKPKEEPKQVIPISKRPVEAETIIRPPKKEEPRESSMTLAESYESVKEYLLDKDIQPAAVKKIITQLQQQAPFVRSTDTATVVKSIIASMIPVSTFGVKQRHQGKVVAFVGPTGVGKTTCVAKLATISKMLHHLDIGLITLDTYRLGAIDQLKVFSQISEMDLLVAYEAEDLPKLVDKFKKKDIIFLDTAGRSQNNTKMLHQLKSALGKIDIDRIILALSLTSTSQVMLDAAKKFGELGANGLVFTKMDEAASFGSIVNVAARFPYPVFYLTNGQIIPDDIIAADADNLSELIYSGKTV